MSLRDKYTDDEWTHLEDRIQAKSQKKSDYERVTIQSDDSGHQYVIPYSMNDIFFNMLDDDEYDEFDEVFGKFRCSGDPFMEQEFYIKKK